MIKKEQIDLIHDNKRVKCIKKSNAFALEQTPTWIKHSYLKFLKKIVLKETM